MTATVTSLCAYREQLRLRAETQPAEPAAPMLSDEDRAVIRQAARAYNAALREANGCQVAAALRIYNTALVALAKLQRICPLEAILSYSRELRVKRDRLARSRARFDSVIPCLEEVS